MIRTASMFSQALKLIDRGRFERAVRLHGAGQAGAPGPEGRAEALDALLRQQPPPVIGVWDSEKRRTIEFATNIFHLAASTVAAIYKDRWQIELFFKALKQNLKVKTFVGTTENAVKTQIWTALIAMLLKLMQLGRSATGPCRTWPRSCGSTS